MSSDETPPSTVIPQTYKVRILPWRKAVERELDMIDTKYGDCTPTMDDKGERRGWDGRGRTRLLRERSEHARLSIREAAPRLPKELYQEQWFDLKTEGQRRALMVSEKQFKWLYVVSRIIG